MSDRGNQASSGEQLYGLLAEFETPAAIYEAAERVRDAIPPSKGGTFV